MSIYSERYMHACIVTYVYAQYEWNQWCIKKICCTYTCVSEHLWTICNRKIKIENLNRINWKLCNNFKIANRNHKWKRNKTKINVCIYFHFPSVNMMIIASGLKLHNTKCIQPLFIWGRWLLQVNNIWKSTIKLFWCTMCIAHTQKKEHISGILLIYFK